MGGCYNGKSVAKDCTERKIHDMEWLAKRRKMGKLNSWSMARCHRSSGGQRLAPSHGNTEVIGGTLARATS